MRFVFGEGGLDCAIYIVSADKLSDWKSFRVLQAKVDCRIQSGKYFFGVVTVQQAEHAQRFAWEKRWSGVPKYAGNSKYPRAE